MRLASLGSRGVSTELYPMERWNTMPEISVIAQLKTISGWKKIIWSLLTSALAWLT